MDIKIENGVVTMREGNVQRRIGNLMESNGTRILRVSRDVHKHLMRNFKSYGFAKKLIEQDFFDYLQVVEKDGMRQSIYLVSRVDALSEGRFYKADGFEEQIMIPRSYLMRNVITKQP